MFLVRLRREPFSFMQTQFTRYYNRQRRGESMSLFQSTFLPIRVFQISVAVCGLLCGAARSF